MVITRRNNIAEANSILITVLMVLWFYLNLGSPLLSIIIFSSGFAFVYTMKALLHGYICFKFKRVDFLITALSFWLSIVILSYNLSSGFMREIDVSMVYSISLLVLIATFYLKKNKVRTRLMAKSCDQLKSGMDCRIKLEGLLWMSEIRKTPHSDATRMLFDGYLSTIFTKKARTKNKQNRSRKSRLGSLNLRADAEEQSKLISSTRRPLGLKRKRSSAKSSYSENLDEKFEEKDRSLTWSQSKNMDLFYAEITAEYIIALRKFPEDQHLRISFLYYLIDFIQLINLVEYQNKEIQNDNWGGIEVIIKQIRLSVIMGDTGIKKTNSGSQRSSNRPKTQLDSDFKSEVASARLSSAMSSQLEKTAQKYMDLWQVLSDDTPKIGKVREAIRVSLMNINAVDNLWTTGKAHKLARLETKKMYALYLREILRQVKDSQKLMKKIFWQVKKLRREKENTDNLNEHNSIGGLSSPIFVVSFDQDEKLILKDCNLNFCKAVGYSRTAIKDRGLHKIVPHQSFKFYRHYLNGTGVINQQGPDQNFYKTEPDNEKNAMDEITTTSSKQYRTISIKKSNKALEFYSAKLNLIVQLQKENCLLVKLLPKPFDKPEAELLVTRSGKIVGHNAQCMDVLNRREFLLENSGVSHITELFKRFPLSCLKSSTHWRNHFGKDGAHKSSLGKELGRKKTKHLSEVISCMLKLQLTPQKSEIPMRKDYKVGVLSNRSSKKIKQMKKKMKKALNPDSFSYSLIDPDDCWKSTPLKIVKFWKDDFVKVPKSGISELLRTQSRTHSVLSATPKRIFQFRLSSEMKICGRFVDVQPKSARSRNFLKSVASSYNSENQFSQEIDYLEDENPTMTIVLAIRSYLLARSMKKKGVTEDGKSNYAQGIRTKRLFNGYVRDINDLDDDEQDDLSGDEDLRFGGGGKKKNMFGKEIEQSNSNFHFKNRIERMRYKQNLENILSDRSKVIPSVRIYKVMSLLIGVLCAVFYFYVFSIKSQDLEEGGALLKLDRQATLRSSLLQTIFGRVTDLALLNQGVNLLRGSQPEKFEEYKLESYEWLQIRMEQLRENHLMIEEETPKISLAQKIKSINNKAFINITTGTESKNWTFNQATQKVLSMTQNIVQKDIKDVKFGDSDVEFVVRNVINYIHTAVIQITDIIRTTRAEIKERQPLNYQENSRRMMIGSLIILIIICPVIYLADKAKEAAVEAFYGFPDGYIKERLSTCENFVSYIQNSEANFGDDIMEDFDNQQPKQLNQGADNRNRGKSKAKSTKGSKKKLKSSSDNLYINLKKKKKKGSIVPIIGKWKFILALMICINYLFVSSLMKQHQHFMIDCLNKSTFLNNMNRIFVISVAFRNALVAYIIRPKKMIRGLSSLGTLKRYDRLIGSIFHDVTKSLPELLTENSPFTELITDIYHNDACKPFNKYKNYTEHEMQIDCDKFKHGILHKGFTIASNDFLQDVSKIYYKVLHILHTDTLEKYPFESDCPEFDPNFDPKMRMNYCRLTSKEFRDITIFTRKFVDEFSQKIADEVLEYMLHKVQAENETRLKSIIQYYAIVVLIILALVQTAVLLNEEILDINLMMKFHDLKDIKQNEKMKLYIGKWIDI